MNDLVRQLKPMLEGKELVEALQVLPEYKYEARSKSERLIALLNIYNFFIPNRVTLEAYNYLYLATVASLESKGSIEEIKRLNDNFRIIKGKSRLGIVGGLDSFRLTGRAGIGKSATIQRCINVISESNLVRIEKPPRDIIPVLVVECVSDGSFKSLLYSVLQEIDNILGSSYLVANKHQTTTVDMLLTAVSNILINHVAVLVIDETERVANFSNKGETLMNYLTQLVNQSNVPICFVGNETCNSYFKNKEYLARRTIGISMKPLSFDEDFHHFVKLLMNYQYVLFNTELNSELLRELYSLSNGIPSIVVALFIEAQKTAIISDEERLSINLIKRVFKEKFATLHIFLNSSEEKLKGRKETAKDNRYKKIRCIKEGKLTSAAKLSSKDLSKMLSLIRDEIDIEFVEI